MNRRNFLQRALGAVVLAVAPWQPLASIAMPSPVVDTGNYILGRGILYTAPLLADGTTVEWTYQGKSDGINIERDA